MKHWASSVALAAALSSVAPVAHAAGFTYHGRLGDGGQPANGRYDFRVTPYASEQTPAPAAAPITLYGVEVSDGQFNTEIDFAENLAPDGWLGVAVRKAGDGDFVDLAGRTEIAAADACWSTTGNALGSAGGFIGTNDAQPLLMRVNNHFGAGIRTYDNPAATTGVSFEVGNATASAARSVALNWGLANAVDSFAGGYSGQVLAGHDRSFVWGGTNQVSRVSSTGTDEFDIWADGGFNAHTGPFRVWTYGGFLINTTVWNDGDDLVIAPQPLPSPDRDVDVRLRTRSDKNGLIRVRDSSGTMELSAAGGVRIIGQVTVDGAASKATAGAWQANSDGRIKQDIVPIGDALDTLAKVRPVTFRYTDAYRAEHPQVADQRYYNVVAQEFATVFPDAVTRSGEYLPGTEQIADNEILQVDTYPAQIVTIAAVQELAKKNAELEATVLKLTARLAKLEAKGK